MTAAMPTSVRIGGVRYRISLDADEIKRAADEAQLEDGTWQAYSDHVRLIIGLDPSHAEDNQRNSLLHEILHCCLRASGAWPNSYARILDSARGTDEGIPVEEYGVAATTGPLLAVLQDNPDLLAWLTSSS